MRCEDANKSHPARHSSLPPSTNTDNELIISTLTGFECDLGDKLAQIDRKTEMQVQELELSECLLFVAQLVELFKHTVVTTTLQNQNEWSNDTSHHLRKQNGATGNTLLDHKVEQIVMDKGLTREQWNCLLYISLSNGDTSEITKVSKKQLQKIHEKASRLLEIDERDAVFALIHAIETYMSKEHFLQK
ncbi:unnamed protein product [Adineta ricciae]|uniref:Uncharacterized protein n=1 Tax=Adineta ricciae TaxID=249248 RepID=A0A814V935_ADIRI|nr:unnamed protein product [Adineta ricciae]CAF1185836.1 unnamed protein product [Adineta ricciae]